MLFGIWCFEDKPECARPNHPTCLFPHFFHKVDILEFFVDNALGGLVCDNLVPVGGGNSTGTIFQKIILKFRTGGSLSKKWAIIGMAQLGEEMSD